MNAFRPIVWITIALLGVACGDDGSVGDGGPVADDGSVADVSATDTPVADTLSVDGSGGQDSDTSDVFLSDARAAQDVGASDASGADVASDSGPGIGCAMPTGGSVETLDFTTIDPVSNLSSGRNQWIQTVFPVGPGEPGDMMVVPEGVRFILDVSTFPSGNLDARYRAELRESDINTFPANGTTQIYRRQFVREEVPSVLYGKLLVFQRFNRDDDGPDCHVTLVGDHQWRDDTATGYIWIDCAGERTRLQDTFLQDRNELVVAIYTHASEGQYKISLNGETLAEGSSVDTSSSTDGGWVQFGTYWSGMLYGDEDQRNEQVASGESTVSFTEHLFEKYSYPGRIDFGSVVSYDPNPAGAFTCP